ncbi:Membrane protein insertion efficiency factor like [Quillaja saponaria]|uniref:Membrane protein insertion efficiency factor like n=1 Tax=Quillaja saponaria TaxID=32244 RepID=A0AAD7VGU6_QUISA|nr:Membrane protein insertion efficiency factor like [Quillaja saponaria]
MVRKWREVTIEEGGGVGFIGNAYLVLWVAVVTFSIVSVIIFSCADGVSKDKTSAADSDHYGAGCAAGCGADCGA